MTTNHTSSAAAQAAPNLESSIFTYREAANQNELEQLLRMRYACFTQSEWANYALIQRNPHEIDLDFFDLRATHVGVFINENGKEIPIGYARFIGQNATKHSLWVNNILAKFPQLRLKKNNATYPFVEKFGQKHQSNIQDFFQKNEPYQTVELSRLCVAALYQSATLCQFLITSNMAYTVGRNRKTNLVFIVKEKMKKIITRNGAQPIEGLSTQFFDLNLNTYYFNQSVMQPETQTQLNEIAHLFTKNNCIRFDKKAYNFF